MNVTWFSTDAVANSLEIEQLPPDISTSVKLVSPQHLPVWSNHSSTIASDYHTQFEAHLGFYEANIYDSCMILCLSVIEVGSDDPSLVEEVLPGVAENFIGLTGPCGLDQYGDRLHYNTGLYAIEYDPGLRWMLVGYYHSPINEVTWESTQ